MSLGENISSLRQRAGMSQDALAERLEVSRQSVSKWETDASVPELEKLLKLSDIFGVTLDALIKGGAAEKTCADAPRPPEVPAGERTPGGQERPETGVPQGQRTMGNVFFIMGVAVIVLPTLLLGLAGLLLGLLVAVPLIICGAICWKCRKRAALWCAWTVWLSVDAYITSVSGASTWTVLWLLSGINPEVLSEMTAEIVVSGVMLAAELAMTVWTLVSFRRAVLPRTPGRAAVVAALWLGRIVGVWLLTGVLVPRILDRELFWALNPVRLLGMVGQDVLTPTALAATVAILRKRPKDG